MVLSLVHPAPAVAAWKSILRTNVVNGEILADLLELTAEQRRSLWLHPRFALNVPLRLVNKMEKGTLDDPLLKQFLARIEERESESGFACDPVQDGAFKQAHKFLHKYQGRALILCSSACAMHCRFCFRQNFDYDTSIKGFEAALSAIAEDPSINEVILSGGDPLSLDDAVLFSLIRKLERIPHVKKLRFHTRFPIGIPERIDESFLSCLAQTSLQVWFCIHANHPKEFDSEIFAALREIQKLGIPVLNQGVLLKGVNDTASVLVELYQLLADNGVMPYYLHQLDRVFGSARFEVAEAEGKALIQEIAKQLPGYAVPRYVKEVPGQPGKVVLA